MVYIWMLRLILRQKEENIDKVPLCQTTSDFGTEGFHGAPITKVQPSPLPSQAFIKSFYISNFNSWFTHDMAECSISSGCSLPRIEMGLNTLYHEFWKTKFKENCNILLYNNLVPFWHVTLHGLHTDLNSYIFNKLFEEFSATAKARYSFKWTCTVNLLNRTEGMYRDRHCTNPTSLCSLQTFYIYQKWYVMSQLTVKVRLK